MDEGKLDFTAIYAWEAEKDLFEKPDPRAAAAEYNLTADAARRWLDSITLFPVTVSANLTDHSPGDLSHFLLTHVEREDYCVVKIDIDGEEWNLLPRLELTGAIRLIDEFMVEVHFHHPSMAPYFWSKSWFPRTLEETEDVLRQLRSRDDMVFHYWP